MTARLPKLSPHETQARLTSGQALLIDIREPDEFARSRIAGALSRPLSRWGAAPLAVEPGRELSFTCRSGMRTDGACDRLAVGIDGPAFILDGGLNGWVKAGLPVEADRSAPLEIMRQVQIAAGSLILIGALLGWLVAPGWFGLSAFVGAGLLFAGLTGFCGMARLLMLAPWNRARPAA